MDNDPDEPTGQHATSPCSRGSGLHKAHWMGMAKQHPVNFGVDKGDMEHMEHVVDMVTLQLPQIYLHIQRHIIHANTQTRKHASTNTHSHTLDKNGSFQ